MTTLRTNDARNRAVRTFLQGLATDVLAALVLLLLPVFTSANGWGDFEWQVLGFLTAKTVAVTVMSYVMRQYLDSSRFPTPLPPADPGEPDDEEPILGKAVGGYLPPVVEQPGGFRAPMRDNADGDPDRP